jgi:hypothetical protein
MVRSRDEAAGCGGRRWSGAWVALAWCSVLAAGGPARAGFDYSFALTGTIDSVSDLAWPRDQGVGGTPIHLLPGLSAGDPITATGTFTTDASGAITAASVTVSAPAGFGFSDTFAPAISELLDATNPGLGFFLTGGLFPSTHAAVVPSLSAFDVVQRFSIDGSSFSAQLMHPSLQLNDAVATVTATFDSASVGGSISAVPEPSAAALVGVGLTVAGMVLRRRARASSGDRPRRTAGRTKTRSSRGSPGPRRD